MEVIKSFATIDQGRSCRKPINGNPREGNSLYLFKSRLLLPIQVIFWDESLRVKIRENSHEKKVLNLGNELILSVWLQVDATIVAWVVQIKCIVRDAVYVRKNALHKQGRRFLTVFLATELHYLQIENHPASSI